MQGLSRVWMSFTENIDTMWLKNVNLILPAAVRGQPQKSLRVLYLLIVCHRDSRVFGKSVHNGS